MKLLVVIEFEYDLGIIYERGSIEGEGISIGDLVWNY